MICVDYSAISEMYKHILQENFKVSINWKLTKWILQQDTYLKNTSHSTKRMAKEMFLNSWIKILILMLQKRCEEPQAGSSFKEANKQLRVEDVL